MIAGSRLSFRWPRRRATRQLGTLVLALAVATPLSLAAQDSAGAATGPRSVMSGVFSTEQAQRGRTAHRSYCLECHGAENYTGDAFEKLWSNRTVFDILDRLRTTMPDDNPGKYPREDYIDIIAYILEVNGYPAGPQALPTDDEGLSRVKIDAPPPKK